MPEEGSRHLVSGALALAAVLLLCAGFTFAVRCSTLMTFPTPLDNMDLQPLIAFASSAGLVISTPMALLGILLLGKVRLRDCSLALPYVALSGSCLLVLLLAANVQALRDEAHAASLEYGFIAEFDDYICNLRGIEVCNAGGLFDKVLGALATSVVNDTARAQAATRARDYCRPKLGDFILPDMQNFLHSFTITEEVDKWCGSKALGLPTNATALFSPTSMNRDRIIVLRGELPKLVREVSIFVGSAVVCMAWLFYEEKGEKKKNSMQASAGGDFELVKDKMAQEMEV